MCVIRRGSTRCSLTHAHSRTLIYVHVHEYSFGMTNLDADIVALMTKRVYDVAGCNPSVSVYLNGKKLPINSFAQVRLSLARSHAFVPYHQSLIRLMNGFRLQYVKLYMKPEQPYEYLDVSDRWKIAIASTDGTHSALNRSRSCYSSGQQRDARSLAR